MKRLILLLFVSCFCIGAMDAQTVRDYVRRGNRLMKDTVGGKDLSEKAIVQYKKALEKDSTMAIARYNLGNALVRQEKAQDAMSEYMAAAKYATDKQHRSDIYHNMGVIFQASQQYDKAVECYKESLRNDPSNNETRYNYVLAKWQLKNQQSDGQDNGDGQDQNKQDQQNNQDNQQQQQQKDQQDKQQDQPQQQPQPVEQDRQNMSKETAERLLQAAMRNEKETQEKLQQQQKEAPRRRLQKQW